MLFFESAILRILQSQKLIVVELMPPKSKLTVCDQMQTVPFMSCAMYITHATQHTTWTYAAVDGTVKLLLLSINDKYI